MNAHTVYNGRIYTYIFLNTRSRRTFSKFSHRHMQAGDRLLIDTRDTPSVAPLTMTSGSSLLELAGMRSVSDAVKLSNS